MADARRSEGGYITILLAMLVAGGFMMGALAVSIDTSRWYDEMNRIQKAADAAALAGVPYLPYEFNNAKTRALEVAKRNGYDDASADVTVLVEKGAIPSQLKVTISSRIDNTFGAFIGLSRTTLTRSGTADYKGKAPMGSPCNTFGNEPSGGTTHPLTTATGSALDDPPLAGCSSNPQFWATIQGPEVDKQWGDRYQSWNCAGSTTDNCSAGKNTEYSDPGYFWVIKVTEDAKNKPITVQLYDPAYVESEIGSNTPCGDLPPQTGFTINPNPFVTRGDGKKRYGKPLAGDLSSTGAPHCTNDHESGTAIGHAMTTSFVLRGTSASGDPMMATPITGCTKQYVGTMTIPTVNSLTSTSTANYNSNLAQIFHNWTELCTFVPAAAGDYFLQVRNNVAAGGSAAPNGSKPSMIYSGNPKAAEANPSTMTKVGSGDNSFGIRALIQDGFQSAVSVSGYDRMPIYQYATGTTNATFNLIRVLPAAAGNFIEFSFFDVADSETGSASIKVLVPSKATGSITTNPFPGGCTAVGGFAGVGATYPTCVAPVSNAKNNGKVEKMTIPVPSDYMCDITKADECWYQVQVTFGSGNVSDITTWDATIVGDPVRLIK
jgi:hypothetical protein